MFLRRLAFLRLVGRMEQVHWGVHLYWGKPSKLEPNLEASECSLFGVIKFQFLNFSQQTDKLQASERRLAGIISSPLLRCRLLLASQLVANCRGRRTVVKFDRTAFLENNSSQEENNCTAGEERHLYETEKDGCDGECCSPPPWGGRRGRALQVQLWSSGTLEP